MSDLFEINEQIQFYIYLKSKKFKVMFFCVFPISGVLLLIF